MRRRFQKIGFERSFAVEATIGGQEVNKQIFCQFQLKQPVQYVGELGNRTEIVSPIARQLVSQSRGTAFRSLDQLIDFRKLIADQLCLAGHNATASFGGMCSRTLVRAHTQQIDVCQSA